VDVQDTKDELERPRDMHNKVEIQINSEFQSLTLSQTRSPEPPCIQIDA
jgi:rRNA processing protein Krr1/Pno1